MKPETVLEFSSEWGGKIYHEHLTTVRGQDKLYLTGSIMPAIFKNGIYHVDKTVGNFQVQMIVWRRICDFTQMEIVDDIGTAAAGNNPQLAFFEILAQWYAKKPWWQGKYTVMQKLYLRRVAP
jgi:hypothetical protein